MFVLTDEAPAYWWPVSWLEPQDGGSTIERSIEVRFLLLETDAIAELLTPPDIDGKTADEIRALQVTWFRRMARDWRGIVGPDGKVLPFDDAFIGRWLRVPNVAEAIGRSFGAFIRAQPDIIRGNSNASPDGLPGASDAVPATS